MRPSLYRKFNKIVGKSCLRRILRKIWVKRLFRLRGVSSPDRVDGIKSEISKYHENQTLRVTLKFLRQKGYQTAFDALMSEMEEPEYFLENPIVSTLYETIVSKGDYSEAEKLIESQELSSCFTDQPSRQGHWERFEPKKPYDPWPCARGGHQMVFYDQKCYLFGGWTGGADLGDFWEFDYSRSSWRLINESSEAVGGPGPRSCHKMAIDSQRRIIYTLGRYVDSNGFYNPFFFNP